jgi:hypothetical protein
LSEIEIATENAQEVSPTTVQDTDVNSDIATSIENAPSTDEANIDANLTDDGLKEVQSSDEPQKPQRKADELVLNANGEITWNENIIARIVPNNPLFAPKIEITSEELKQGESAQVINERLYSWLDEQIRSELFPLTKLRAALDFVATEQTEETAPVEAQAEEPAKSEASTEEEAPIVSQPAPNKGPKLPLSDIAKSLGEKIHAANGILDRTNVERDIGALSQDNRRELRHFGVKFGRSAIYLPLLLKPKAARLNAILNHFSQGLEGEVALPRMGVTSFAVDEQNPDLDYTLSGFKNVGGRIIRLDILDRVIDALFEAQKEANGAIALPLAVVSLLGVSNDVAHAVVEGLGWVKNVDDEGNIKYSLPKKRFAPRPPRTENANSQPNGERKFDKKFENRPRPAAQNQGFGKKRKDKNEKPKRHHDFKTRENNNLEDSPFAILAKLKDNMGKPEGN